MTNVVQMQTANAKELFDLFWQAFPKRVGKPKALFIWKHIVNGGYKTQNYCKESNTFIPVELQADPSEIIDGARRYYEKMRLHGPGQYGFVDGGKWLLEPANWLTRGGWMDD